MRWLQRSRSTASFSKRSSAEGTSGSPSSANPCARTRRSCSTWNGSTWNALLGRALALPDRFVVLGSACRNHHDLPEPALADAHRRDTFVLADADVDGPAITAVHRVERDRASALDCPLHDALGQPLEVALARVGATFDVEHHSAGGLLVLAQQNLVREELERVESARLAACEHLGRR